METEFVGNYLRLADFCCCTETYNRYRKSIDPFPQNIESIIALRDLAIQLLDPVIATFGIERFRMTYGFCSSNLKTFLERKDPLTGIKYGHVSPSRDQHIAHEKNRRRQYFCDRLGAACDFRIVGLNSNRLVEWILGRKLPFDSLYFYGSDRPIHISYGPQHKRAIWAFTEKGTPTRKGIEDWVRQARRF